MKTYIEPLSERLILYTRMARRYGEMFAGRSYAHLDQGLGKHFTPGRLAGYYNDLSVKTEWRGPVDHAGIPLTKAPGEKYVYFPIVVLQKALGHWETWLSSERQSTQQLASFIQIARWALDSQDENGGWVVWPPLGRKGAMPYSAMAQGEAMSVFVRAFSTTEEEPFLEGARRALTLMLTPLDKGGTSWQAPEGLVLEEVPYTVPRTILNGWIFALYGLYDLLLVEDSQEAQEALAATLSALLAYLPKYDAGFWSFYDTSGILASPAYHRLHIAQLRALELTYPEHAGRFRKLRKTFQEQHASRLNRARAISLKAYQKLQHPPEHLKP